MNITDASQILGIPESYIKEYIRNGLLPNHRVRNKNPDFSDSDIILLKEIIILRKLDWGSLDIYDNYKRKNKLLKITESLLKYEDPETEKAKIYQMILDDNSDQLDIERYWELTCDSEELSKDYNEPFSSFESLKDFTRDHIFKRIGFKKENGIGIWKYLLILLGISFGVALIKKFAFHSDDDLIFTTIYPFLLILAIIAIGILFFIMYRLLGARSTTFLANILILILILFFAAIFILFLVAAFNTVRDWIVTLF